MHPGPTNRILKRERKKGQGKRVTRGPGTEYNHTDHWSFTWRTRCLHRVVSVFVGSHQNIIETAINRRSSMIRKDPTSSASPPGASVRVDEHLVLDAFDAVSSESENCRKIAAESDILFLSVATAPIALFGDVYGIL